MEEFSNQAKFEVSKSPIREVYELLGAKTPLDLSNLYSEEDQKLMKSGGWDYNNPDFITNKVKNIIEAADTTKFTDEERYWQNAILWFWYHHAISCAVYRYKDKEKAKLYASKALELQGTDHPNQITKLLYFLVNDQLIEAEKWVIEITNEDEKETANTLIQDYKDGKMF